MQRGKAGVEERERRAVRSNRRGSVPADEAGNESDEKHDKEDIEQDLRDPAGRRRQPSEAESAGNESDNEKYCRPIQHGFLL
jgi:hypothetical protein